jgi:hypothetical protein
MQQEKTVIASPNYSLGPNYALKKYQEYKRLRLLALIPVSIALTLLNLLVYAGFQSIWPAGSPGIDLSFLGYILPAAGKVYDFHAACGHPGLAFLYASFVIFNLVAIIPLDIATLYLTARYLPIYRTVRRPVSRPSFVKGLCVVYLAMFGVGLFLGLAELDAISPHDCTRIGSPALGSMAFRATTTAWLAMFLDFIWRR